MGNLAWAFVWGLVGVVVALAVVLLVGRRQSHRKQARELSHRARQLRMLQKEATHDLMLRLTDYQDLDAWWEEYQGWCRRVGDKLAQDFSAGEREMFDAEHEPPLGTLAHSDQPRRDAFRHTLGEKVRRLEAVIRRHLD